MSEEVLYILYRCLIKKVQDGLHRLAWKGAAIHLRGQLQLRI